MGKINRLSNFRKTVSPRHFLNRVRVTRSFVRREIVPRGNPSLIHVEVTNRCNLRCKMCGRTANDLRGDSDLSLREFRQIADQAAEMCTEMILLHSWGEPLLNKELPEIIAYASAKGLPTWMSTNATLLDMGTGKALLEAGLKGLVFSIDGATAATYESIRVGADFHKTVSNVKAFLELKERIRSDIMCTVQMIQMPETIGEIEQFKAMWRPYRINVLVKPLVKWTEDAGCAKPRDFVCDKLWFWMKIQSDGGVYPCGHDFKKGHLLGNAKTQRLSDIWRNERFRAFRERMIDGWKGIDICKTCGYLPPRKRNLQNNAGFLLFDAFTLTRLLFILGYKKQSGD